MWDVFISHASEDKENLVRALAKQLNDVYRVNVWYDEFTLEYGDSLINSIEKGLRESKYGVVILSKNFFKKVWTERERVSLETKELLLNRKVIIPIWYKITREEVAEYSFTLADKFAIYIGDSFDVDELAIKIIKVIRPDIYENINRMIVFERLVKDSIYGATSYEDFAKLPVPPIRHKELSTQMKARLKLIHSVIKDVDPRSYDEYEEDFRRSTNIDREMIITELITSAYVDCTNTKQYMTRKEKAKAYVFTMSLGRPRKSLRINPKELKEYTEILDSYIKDINAFPIIEFRFDSSEDTENNK